MGDIRVCRDMKATWLWENVSWMLQQALRFQTFNVAQFCVYWTKKGKAEERPSSASWLTSILYEQTFLSVVCFMSCLLHFYRWESERGHLCKEKHQEADTRATLKKSKTDLIIPKMCIFVLYFLFSTLSWFNCWIQLCFVTLYCLKKTRTFCLTMWNQPNKF